MGTAKKISIIDQIRSNNKLLSLPQVLAEILQEVGKEDFSPDSLSRIILKDPSLTGRVLRLANSAFYHRISEIKTVNQAVSIMGVTTVKCLALSSSILHPDRVAAESGVDPKAFFSHVLSVAAASESIAKAISHEAPEEAFIAGLLHDVGILFFLHHYPKEYSRVIRKEVKSDTLVDAENMVFEIDHCDVGFHLAETWNLPSYMIDSIAHHHSVEKIDEGDVFQNVVALAVLLAGDRFSGFEMGIEQRLSQIGTLSKRLSLEPRHVDEISASLLSRAIGAAEYLGVDIGDIEDMLVKANHEIWKSYLTIENLFKERQELSANLLKEERAKGAVEAKNVAMATLSHYLNNATMVIYGRSQLMNMLLTKGETDRLLESLPTDLEVINKSIAKIVAVLGEMREISPIDQSEYYNMSKALNIDDRIEKRLAKMDKDDIWTAQSEPAPT